MPPLTTMSKRMQSVQNPQCSGTRATKVKLSRVLRTRTQRRGTRTISKNRFFLSDFACHCLPWFSALFAL